MLSVVIPCCNESGNIPRFESELLPELQRLDMPFELIAVDDGSTDATAQALSELSSRHPELKILRHEKNRGLGAALKTGIGAVKGEWVVALDADLTFHPRFVGTLIKTQGASNADCVCGSPVYRGVPLHRGLPSLLVNALYRILFDRHLTSYTPMFRLYRSSALRELRLASEGFEISAEILVRMIKRGLRVAEVPVPLTTRTAGTSKLRALRELKNHASLIWRLLRASPY